MGCLLNLPKPPEHFADLWDFFLKLRGRTPYDQPFSCVELESLASLLRVDIYPFQLDLLEQMESAYFKVRMDDTDGELQSAGEMN